MKIKQLIAAIKSRKNYNKEKTAEQKRRLEICSKCPFNSDNYVSKSVKVSIWIRLNKFLNTIFGVELTDDSICVDCGCQIFHKSTQTDKDLICQKGYWNGSKK